jgi:hypothetical protein
MLNPWIALTVKAMQVGLDAQNVIFLRMMRLSAGGVRGQGEARRMVSEKISASAEAQAAAVSGIIAARNEAVVAGQVIRGLEKRGSREQAPFISRVIALYRYFLALAVYLLTGVGCSAAEAIRIPSIFGRLLCLGLTSFLLHLLRAAYRV